MAYGSDISEGLPITFSNPAGATYTPSGFAYDMAIAGLPFFLNPLDEQPYRRVTAQYRKQQIDQSREPGEQTLTGWWLRSQSSFHYGQGIKFFEPVQDESLRFQYTESKGINVWEKGQCTLLKDTDKVHLTTGSLRPNKRPWQSARSIQWTQNGIITTYSITTKALASNIATLTTSVVHSLIVGMTVTITGVDDTFNGTYVILTVPTTTTFTYAKTYTGTIVPTAVSPVGVVTLINRVYDGVLLWDEYDVDKVYPTITASVVTKALATNVATLTTSADHGLAVGMEILVAGVDATFNGTYEITAVPTTKSFRYAKTYTGTIAPTAVSPAGTVTSSVMHFINYAAGQAPVYAICDDGVDAYWVTNNITSGKLQVLKKSLNAPPATAGTSMFTSPGIVVTNAVMEYTKERIIMCVNDSVYEFPVTQSTMPSAVYSHGDPDHVFTSITSSGAAIYVAGFAGIQSNIYKFTLDTAGAMPVLTSAITAAELPVGEICFKISFYLGYMAIGTSEGMRVASISETDGSIAYGPLLFESVQPVYDFAFRDKYIWAASSVDGQAGVTRVNLGTEISTLIFAYAWDLYDPLDTILHHTTATAFIGNTNRLLFCSAGDGVDGSIYIESEAVLMETGYLQTGYVRYNTLENKIFKLIQARIDTSNGSSTIQSVTATGAEYNIGVFAQGNTVPEVNIGYPTGSQQYLGFKFTLNRSSLDSTQGPLFTGYQIKSLPAIPRQRLIQFPLFCYDREMDKFNNEVGYEGSAYDRMAQLEAVENVGDTIKVEDFRTGESFIGLIEEMDFINKTPTDKRFSGYGGTLLVTIRTV